MGGDAPAPTANETTAERMAAFIQYFPEYLGVQLQELPGLQQALIDASAKSSPQIAAIQAQQLRDYGPEFNRIGSDIAAENAMRQAESDLAVIKGPGRELVREARTTAEMFDPEYFGTRSLTADRLNAVLNSFGTDVNLSGAERAEVERALNQTQSTRGVANVPSAVETLTAANAFGGALQAKRDAMTDAINAATSFLSAARSGTDAFQVATGRPATVNQGANQFVPVSSSPGEKVFDQASSFMGGINEAANLGMAINANRRDSLDRFTGVLGSIPNIS